MIHTQEQWDRWAKQRMEHTVQEFEDARTSRWELEFEKRSNDMLRERLARAEAALRLAQENPVPGALIGLGVVIGVVLSAIVFSFI